MAYFKNRRRLEWLCVIDEDKMLELEIREQGGDRLQKKS